MKVAVIGAGNVGVAIAADLSIKGHEVSLIKTSNTKSEVFEKIQANGNRVFLKENQQYHETTIADVSYNIEAASCAEVVFITVQSTYHEDVIKKLAYCLNKNQIVVCICSYMSYFYFRRCCKSLPVIVETIGPYLEGRIELEDKPDEIVFRVGCRLTRSPLSISRKDADEYMYTLKSLDPSFSDEYNLLEAALLNPNMVLHTVGAIMSIPRIEYSHGDFCMYREAYSHENPCTLNIMQQLDEEKRRVLKALGCKPVDIYDAGGFLGNKLESFFRYSESSDRAISPTSVKSRYITEDVSQGLVLLESIAHAAHMTVPITTALIDIASAALLYDFRECGRTLARLGAQEYIRELIDEQYGIA